MNSRRWMVSGALALMAALSYVLLPQAASAAPGDIVVNSSADVVADDGECTLREAVTAANTNTASGASAGECIAGNFGPPDTIIFENVFDPIVLSQGAIVMGNIGDLTLDGPGVVVDGGGLDGVFQVNVGPVFLDGLTIRNGRENTGGGLRLSGASEVTLTEVTVEDNTGGGIFSDNSTDLTLIRSSVRNNTSSANGGGILTFGVVEIIDSTISGNTAGQHGGGVYLDGRLDPPELTILNSTISGNTATNSSGGAIFVDDTAIADIAYSTITNNSAPDAAGIASFGSVATSTTVSASIVADNSGDDLELVDGATQSFVSGDNNIVGTGSGVAAFTGLNDLTGQTADLGPLQFNGGDTDTHLPDSGSVAVDHISTGVTAPPDDQRGSLRPRGSGTDAGSVERRSDPCAGVDFTANDGPTLDAAINCFNTSGVTGIHTISISNDITYTSAMRFVDSTNPDAFLEVRGNGFTLDADGLGSVLTVIGGNLHIENVSLTGGNSFGGGAILAEPDTVARELNLSVSSSTLDDNSAFFGAGIAMNGGNLTVNNSTISNNGASFIGGGVYAGGSSTAVIENTTISNNFGGNSGGGIYSESSELVTVRHSTITENLSEVGSALAVTGGELVTQANILAGNSPVEEISIDPLATLTSAGYNVHGDSNVTMDATDEFVNTPDLGPLQDNGGTTATHLPDTSVPSVAVDLVPVALNPPIDQRGVPRPQGSMGDAGAVEARSEPCTGYSSTVASFVAFDAAIECFNTAILPGTYTIELDDDIAFDSVITSITKPSDGFALVIEGNGYTLDAAQTGRVLDIDAGAITVNETVLTGGDSGAGVVVSGGAINVNESADVVMLTITNSTIVGNESAIAQGGGIHFFDLDGSLRIVNSTISDNIGGGVFMRRGDGEIIASTITGNRRFGLQADSTASVYVEASIVADNQSEFFDDVSIFLGTTDPFQSGGFNVVGAVETGITAFGATDLTDTDPVLANLADNGGPTPTHRPAPSSPAVDFVTGTPANPQALDQRGTARPQGAEVDAGSVELEPIDGLTVLPTPCPVYDSTTATGALAGAFAAGEIRTLQTTGTLPGTQGVGMAQCVPAGASAVVFTVSAIDPQGVGNLRLSESGVVPQGGVVNYTSNGFNNANTVTVPISALGQVDVAANASGTDVRLAAIGYYSSTGTLQFTPVTPCAVSDSRPFATDPPSGVFEGPFAAGANFPDIDVVGTVNSAQGGNPIGVNCGIPTSADAVVVNIVAIRPQGVTGFAGKGFLAAAATGTDPSEATTPFFDSTLNNSATTMIPLNGGETIAIDIEAVTGSPSSHVRVVVLGYLEDSGLDYRPLNPCAAFDSRDNIAGDPNPPTGLFAGKRIGNEPSTAFGTNYQITGSIPAEQGGELDCGVPTTAKAVLVNLVAIQPEAVGNFRAYAQGSSPTGGVVNFNSLAPPLNNSSAVVVPLNDDGRMSVVAVAPSLFFEPAVHARGVILGFFE